MDFSAISGRKANKCQICGYSCPCRPHPFNQISSWHGYSSKEEPTRRVCNAIFRTRDPVLWGEGTTACASDSKQFGAWDQNLITEWHARYGGRGVMIY
jgi:TnpA family transposase